MWSGIVSQKRAIRPLGIHQKFDATAYRLIKPYLKPGSFPRSKQILNFEGANGPDGLKLKSPGLHEPSHIYDPANDTGEVPTHIANHYRGLVDSLRQQDMIRASFEASWMAHYVTDGLTPAHHFPLEEKLAELKPARSPAEIESITRNFLQTDKGFRSTIRRNWKVWGAKGLLSTHVNFEAGVATALMFYPIRVKLDISLLAKARQEGAVEFFKAQARAVHSYELYDKFIEKGWSIDLAQTVRLDIAPRTAQAIAIIWLLAYLEAGFLDLAEAK